jgi:hypothetical protein
MLLLLVNDFKFSEMALFTLLICGQSAQLLSHAAFGREPIPTEKDAYLPGFSFDRMTLI